VGVAKRYPPDELILSTKDWTEKQPSSIGGHVDVLNRSYFLNTERCQKCRLDKRNNPRTTAI